MVPTHTVPLPIVIKFYILHRIQTRKVYKQIILYLHTYIQSGTINKFTLSKRVCDRCLYKRVPFTIQNLFGRLIAHHLQ